MYKEVGRRPGPIPTQGFIPDKKLTFSYPAENLDEPLAAGGGGGVIEY